MSSSSNVTSFTPCQSNRGSSKYELDFFFFSYFNTKKGEREGGWVRWGGGDGNRIQGWYSYFIELNSQKQSAVSVVFSFFDGNYHGF